MRCLLWLPTGKRRSWQQLWPHADVIAITTLLTFLYANKKWLKADIQELYNFTIRFGMNNLPSFVFKLKTTFPVRYDYIQRPPEKCHSRKRSASGILLNTGIFGQNNKERFRASRNDTLLLEMFSPTFLRMNHNLWKTMIEDGRSISYTNIRQRLTDFPFCLIYIFL